MSCFLRAPSDKFIKLRDDAVIGHIKEKRKKKGEIGIAWSLHWLCKETSLHSQGHRGWEASEACSSFTISEPPSVGAWCDSLLLSWYGVVVGSGEGIVL